VDPREVVDAVWCTATEQTIEAGSPTLGERAVRQMKKFSVVGSIK
jgi:hypothetical protein